MSLGGAITATTIVVLAALALFLWLRGRGGGTTSVIGVRDSRRQIPGAAFARRLVTGPVQLSDLTIAAQENYRRLEEQEDLATLRAFLDDLRDQYAADEAIFWHWSEQRDSLTPSAWSSGEGDRPAHFDRLQWGPLVKWAAEARVVHVDGGGGEVRLAAVPVLEEEQLCGVISVASSAGLRVERSRLKEWMPRHAAQLGRLLRLFTIRREYGRHMRQGRALLQAVQRIQSTTSPDGLVRGICQTAVDVSSAKESALIRWRSDRGKGVVQFATHGFKHRAPFDVSESSLVAQVCRSRMPIVIEDANRLAADVDLFFPADGECRSGSFGVVPLCREDRVLGAIVVASPAVGGVLQDETRNIDILGAVATASLEIVWDLEEASKRARTDALTGLANRRFFEERLDQALNEADRFGVPVSLLVVDLDHFKRVNDTWGHEAGDVVLRKVARLLSDGVRSVDTVARYGGEEIAILLPQTSLGGAVELADRLRRAIAGRTILVAETEISVSASVGVASYPEAVATRDALFPAADRALYEAKHSGRNCVRSASILSKRTKG